MAILSTLAALAVVLRLLLPAPTMAVSSAAGPSVDALTELLAGGGICHGDAGGDDTQPSRTCPMCPLCGPPAPAMAAQPPLLPRPVLLGMVARGDRPPALAPPSASYNAAQPRAPPARSV